MSDFSKEAWNELMGRFTKNESARDRLDKRYFERSEKLATEWEELMAELDKWPDKKK